MEKFEQAMKMIKELQINLSTAYEHFLVRDALKKSIAPNIKGDEAENNLDIINKFIRFFGTTFEAHRKTFALELSKFFDNDKNSLSLYKLINFIHSNIKQFNKNNFILYNKDRNIYDLADAYKPITNKVLSNIKAEIEAEENLIKKLRDYRSKNLAHNDIKTQEISLFIGEIDELFKKTQKRLNTISNRINHEERRGLGTDTNTENCIYSVIDKLK
ncbi:MAG: hypothetical protein PHR61_03560 [Candidatus Absconditabacteria bacterium]|nr:hypothetical protein [Candidatus Absconditabacteria bacterium]